MHPLLVDLQNAVSKLRRAENDLGSINGSYFWNEAYAKVEKAEKEYHECINKLASCL